MSIELMSMIWKKNIPTTKKMILLALTDCANDEGVCWPSIPTLSRKTNLKERILFKYLAEFEKSGLIIKHHRTHPNGRTKSTLYQLNLHNIEQLLSHPKIKKQPIDLNPDHQEHKSRVHKMQGEGAPRAGGRVHDMHPSKENHHIQPSNINTANLDLPTSSVALDKHIDDFFDRVWDALPNKKKKKDAQIYWKKNKLVLKGPQILAAAILYAQRCKSIDPTYIIQSGNWIIKERWEDDVANCERTVVNKSNYALTDEQRMVFPC